MATSVKTILESAINGLRQNENLKVDQILDQIIELAVEYGKIEAMSADQLQVIVGHNARLYFDVDDCLGRFRHLLARLYVRCSESYPQKLEGGLYGFKSDVVLVYGSSNQSARLHIETKNEAGFSQLAIEAP